ncbi:DUF7296 family protein [Enterococcus italicus]|uniref:DUF7296 family protein n=1 Tax=Enterococcus italicus TaxID=246144 RepID=UPI003F48D329
MTKTKDSIIGIAYQNNSGGYFIDNEDVSVFVAVEGHDETDADLRFTSIIEPYSSYCPCCGERWFYIGFKGWPAPEDGLTIKNFVESENEEDNNCVLHLLDGTKKRCHYVC